MHKLLTNTDSNVFVDHKNNIKYDNRRNNLRICNTYQNAQNISIKSNNNSGVTGIGWHKSNNKWRVRIGVHNKSIYLGEYDNLEEAVKVRKEAEIKYFGEFAPQN
jgi:hypothetical protein